MLGFTGLTVVALSAIASGIELKTFVFAEAHAVVRPVVSLGIAGGLSVLNHLKIRLLPALTHGFFPVVWGGLFGVRWRQGVAGGVESPVLPCGFFVTQPCGG